MNTILQTIRKLLKIFLFILLGLLALLAILVFRIITAQMVPKNYTKTVKTGADIMCSLSLSLSTVRVSMAPNIRRCLSIWLPGDSLYSAMKTQALAAVTPRMLCWRICWKKTNVPTVFFIKKWIETTSVSAATLRAA